MSAVTDHYERLLAPIYVWMAGGIEAALARSRAELASLVPHATQPLGAVDRGAGFGMHAIPLAEKGYSVLAIDTSRLLLDLIKPADVSGSIETQEADLLAFRQYLRSPPSLLCVHTLLRRSQRPASSLSLSATTHATDRQAALHCGAQRRRSHPHLFSGL